MPPQGVLPAARPEFRFRNRAVAEGKTVKPRRERARKRMQIQPLALAGEKDAIAVLLRALRQQMCIRDRT